MLGFVLALVPCLAPHANSSDFPGPTYLHPRIHYTPSCLNAKGGASSRDIAGALTHNGSHHVFQLCGE